MIFREWNGAYYNAVARILKSASESALTKEKIREIIADTAFSESFMTIEPSLNENWQLIKPDGTAVTENPPTLPLSELEKRWLKAISLDPRVKLFDFDFSDTDGVTPLFTPDDIYVFDKYSDGDPYENEEYIKIFHTVLDAVKKRYPLNIVTINRTGTHTEVNAMPEYLEYSEKDDKFRLITSGCRYGKTINLARIVSCKPYDGKFTGRRVLDVPAADSYVTVELYDGRNALERAMLHFAHFEKEAERLDDKRYRIKIKYNKDDENEIVIRVLSFGPFLKVTEPEHFIGLIKERLIKQKKCGL